MKWSIFFDWLLTVVCLLASSNAQNKWVLCCPWLAVTKSYLPILCSLCACLFPTHRWHKLFFFIMVIPSIMYVLIWNPHGSQYKNSLKLSSSAWIWALSRFNQSIWPHLIHWTVFDIHIVLVYIIFHIEISYHNVFVFKLKDFLFISSMILLLLSWSRMFC